MSDPLRKASENEDAWAGRMSKRFRTLLSDRAVLDLPNVPPGWRGLVEDALEQLRTVLQGGAIVHLIRRDRVLVVDASPAEVDDIEALAEIVLAAMKASRATCELCGRPAHWRGSEGRPRYLCETHGGERLREPVLAEIVRVRSELTVCPSMPAFAA